MLMSDPAAIKRFVTAGNATVTLSSLKTGARFTYKIAQTKDDPKKFFVSLLTGPDNNSDFRYLGLIDRNFFRTTSKSCADAFAPSARAVKFFCDQVILQDRLPAELEVRHEGRCGKCARKLTTPESVDRGIGPECWANLS